MLVSACSGVWVLYSGDPFIRARPVVTLQVNSGTSSSVATSSSNCSRRPSSVVSTVIIGCRELISKLNSSCLPCVGATGLGVPLSVRAIWESIFSWSCAALCHTTSR